MITLHPQAEKKIVVNVDVPSPSTLRVKSIFYKTIKYKLKCYAGVNSHRSMEESGSLCCHKGASLW